MKELKRWISKIQRALLLFEVLLDKVFRGGVFWHYELEFFDEPCSIFIDIGAQVEALVIFGLLYQGYLHFIQGPDEWVFRACEHLGHVIEQRVGGEA